MSALSQSGALLNPGDILPETLRGGGLTYASSVVERRQVSIPPQGQNIAGSAGLGGGNTPFTFLIAGDGMLDCRSAYINYTLFTSGPSVAPDDGGVFITQQTFMNGYQLENITQNAARVANAKFLLGVSQSYYNTVGSAQGWQLKNPDLGMAAPANISNVPCYGTVGLNYAEVATRAQRSSNNLGNNGLSGVTYSIPLAALSDFWKTSQALPLGILGEINLTLVTGSPADVLFSGTNPSTPNYSIANVSLEYDVLIPSQKLMSLYKEVAMSPSGLNYVVESTTCAQGGTLVASPSSLNEYVALASRATNNLVRSTLFLMNTSGQSDIQYPSQSCFSYANTYSVGWRIGSQSFPQRPPQGAAALWNMTMKAMGSTMVENGTAINRLMWANTTDFSTKTTQASYAASSECTTNRFAYADSFLPSMSFEQVRGGYDKPQLQGVSLSGSAGSQLICSFLAAPPVAYNVYLIVTALKIIRARGGAVTVEGP